MSIGGHDRWEVLISASLTGELSGAERRELDAHLDSCVRCRDTLAAFAAQRRIVAGLRHVPAPRDLGARVRTGIAAGAHADVPWWRRPAVVFAGVGGGLAAVAGALLGIVLLTGAPEDGQVGVGGESPVLAASPTASIAMAAPTPTLTTAASAAPTPVEAPETPEPDPEPDVYLAYTGPFDNLLLTLRDGRTGDVLHELEAPGPPVAAQLSPNGQFLAYVTQMGASGLNEVWVTHLGAGLLPAGAEPTRVGTPLAEWETVRLGESAVGSEFLEQMFWSPNSAYLGYTLAADGAIDVSVLDVALGETHQLTGVGNAYAAGWVAGGDRGSLLSILVSVAATEPMTYVHPFADMAAGTSQPRSDWPIDPAEGALATVPGVFQPIVSPNGDRAIFWRGVMQPANDDWEFVGGGAPYLAELRLLDTELELSNERPLFSDLTIDRDAFTSAGIVWGADSDAYAVWNAQWTGLSQGTLGVYPDPGRVYFGHASDPRDLTEFHAIDETDLPEGASVVDVKVPTWRHLAVTAQLPIGGVMDAPAARLILVTRNTGAVADDVEVLPNGDLEGWFGPAASDAYSEITAP